MTSKLKRDQIPLQKANNWRDSFEAEKKLSFNLEAPQIILQKETYKALAGENENRLRIYIGLEPLNESGRFELCAFAVSAFLLGSGDVYVDYETPVYKLDKKNVDFSLKVGDVIKSIRRYRSWRLGELDAENETAAVRQYIYPNAYLLTKFEMHEIFNIQNKNTAILEFGISKTMNVMILPEEEKGSVAEKETNVFNYCGLCPPDCDDRSIYNS
ncbi:MAG: hypothetical protein GQ525_07415 [Draconibacterium sp.]|nr:hypothetical protein [Draconibacterium sp.]